MHEIYELKEKLLKELEEYASKEMSAGSLDVIDKLAHAIKNICKIIESAEMEEEEYSQRGSYEGGNQGGGSYRGGGRYSRNMGGGSYRGGGRYSRENRYSREGGSYARGRGQNARRDSMGRYSGGSDPGEMVDQLEDMMQDAPNDQIRQQMQQLVNQLNQM